MKNKFRAFTLAEVLIVLAILGVIAVLAVPNISTSTSEKETVAKVTKSYNVLDSAFSNLSSMHNGTWQEIFNNLTNSASDLTPVFGKNILPYFKISKNCQSSTGCFTSGKINKLSSANSGEDINAATDYYKFLLADGMSVALQYSSVTCNEDEDEISDVVCGNIIVDIDGPSKGSYTYGVDIFDFKIYQNTIVPAGFKTADVLKTCAKDGTSCASWVIFNKNMDYLKVDSSTLKCSSGTGLTLDWVSVNSCN